MESLNDLVLLLGLVFFVWSGVLVWGSWQVHVMTRELEREREELWRWARVKALREREGAKWE
jgi:hypothetical protein